MFLLLGLFEKGFEPWRSTKSLKKYFQELPSGIESAYDREIQSFRQLNERKQARVAALLRWILFAERPFTVQELIEAVEHSMNQEDCYPGDELPDSWGDGVSEDDVRNLVEDPCKPFIEVRKEEDKSPSHWTVHFVHYSVKEYLLKRDGAKSLDPPSFKYSQTASEQSLLSISCLKYLTYTEIAEGFEATEEFVLSVRLKYPFLFYAAEFWHAHATKGKPMPRDLMDVACQLFDQNSLNWAMAEYLFGLPLHSFYTITSGNDTNFDSEEYNTFASQESESPPLSDGNIP